MDDPMLVAARRAVLEALEQRRGLIAFSKIEALEMDRLARQYEVTALERLRGGLDKVALQVGGRMPGVDGKEKVTAAARYTEDLRLPGLLHVRLLLSPHPHARIVRVAKEAALAVEGVVAGLLAGDRLAAAWTYEAPPAVLGAAPASQPFAARVNRDWGGGHRQAGGHAAVTVEVV